MCASVREEGLQLTDQAQGSEPLFAIAGLHTIKLQHIDRGVAGALVEALATLQNLRTLDMP
jgi:hypothetical protein